jgi:hypothetical protein
VQGSYSSRVCSSSAERRESERRRGKLIGRSSTSVALWLGSTLGDSEWCVEIVTSALFLCSALSLCLSLSSQHSDVVVTLTYIAFTSIGRRVVSVRT